MIIEIILAIETVAFIVEGYVIWNLMKKTELLETWVEDFTQRIETVQTDLKVIDVKGAFESDDEVGSIFKQIKDTVNQLDNLVGEDVDVI
jgi:enoyl-[acyl-carrier-protein] reductase (NADH)